MNSVKYTAFTTSLLSVRLIENYHFQLRCGSGFVGTIFPPEFDLRSFIRLHMHFLFIPATHSDVASHNANRNGYGCVS